LLQPRDYINSFQLYVALLLLTLGLGIAGARGLEVNVINAPMVRSDVPNAPGGMFPFLFVTIACGAISGFHSLVSSGTTVRQLNRESDALPIGFGAMLTEGALAILVIMACVAGLGAAAWGDSGPYADWKSAGGLATPLSAVVRGGANFLNVLGLPVKYGMTFLAVTVVAFALTTLDSATRLLRFNVEEIFRSVGLNRMANRYVASLIAVAGIGAFGLLPAGKTMWIMFGTTNQLLAGLTLLTVSLFLFKLGRPVLYTLIPMVAMLTMTIWAMLWSLLNFWNTRPMPVLLIVVSVIVLVMTLWLMVEAALSFARGRGGLNLDAPPGSPDGPEPVHEEEDEVAAHTHLG
jgi:carbon starvation protein